MSTLLNHNLEPAEAADILWFLPTHGDGRISAPRRVPAKYRSAT